MRAVSASSAAVRSASSVRAVARSRSSVSRTRVTSVADCSAARSRFVTRVTSALAASAAALRAASVSRRVVGVGGGRREALLQIGGRAALGVERGAQLCGLRARLGEARGPGGELRAELLGLADRRLDLGVALGEPRLQPLDLPGRGRGVLRRAVERGAGGGELLAGLLALALDAFETGAQARGLVFGGRGGLGEAADLELGVVEAALDGLELADARQRVLLALERGPQLGARLVELGGRAAVAVAQGGSGLLALLPAADELGPVGLEGDDVLAQLVGLTDGVLGLLADERRLLGLAGEPVRVDLAAACGRGGVAGQRSAAAGRRSGRAWRAGAAAGARGCPGGRRRGAAQGAGAPGDGARAVTGAGSRGGAPRDGAGARAAGARRRAGRPSPGASGPGGR